MYEPWEAEASSNHRLKLKAKCAELDAMGFSVCEEVTYQAVKKRAMLCHFRSVATTGQYFSLQLEAKVEDPSMVLQGLEAFFDDKHVPLISDNQVVAFQLLKSKPSVQKQVPVALGARPRIRAEHIAVSVHRVHVCQDVPDGIALVSELVQQQGRDDQSIVALLDGLWLQENTLSWEVDKRVIAPAREPSDLVAAEQLTQIFLQPQLQAHVAEPAQHSEALLRLEGRGLVVGDVQSSLGWSLLPDKVVACVRLRSPKAHVA